MVTNDARDGLLLACWKMGDVNLDRKLKNKFEEWCKDSTWGSSDGEGAWMDAFLKKWKRDGRFPEDELANLDKWIAKWRK